MSPNRRPSLQLSWSQAASPEEAAAVVAAIEQFLRDTAPPVASGPAPLSGWVAAARLDAVDREATRHHPWLR